MADPRLIAAPMVGREDEPAKLIGLLDSLEPRLITLEGLRGVGKTRLAQQAALEQERAFSDGVCLVIKYRARIEPTHLQMTALT